MNRALPALRLLAILTLPLLIAGCASLGLGGNKLPVPDATAQLVDKDGADRGRVDLFAERGGLRLEIVARGFLPGTYGMHIHTVGRCAPPDFMSAGPHWNPTGAQHGRDNPMGAHAGDLPNLVVEAGLIGRATATVSSGALTGEGGLLDADGAAFVIHAQADDLRTDPTGNSGGRSVCGTFARP
jgi:superoxide dismutase, Cu-Zn family